MPSMPSMRRSVSTRSGRDAAIERERALGAVHGGHAVAVGLQADREEPEQVRIVVDQQQRGFSLLGHQRPWAWRFGEAFLELGERVELLLQLRGALLQRVGALLLRLGGAPLVAQPGCRPPRRSP